MKVLSVNVGLPRIVEYRGELGAGDEIEFLSREANRSSIWEVVRERFYL